MKNPLRSAALALGLLLFVSLAYAGPQRPNQSGALYSPPWSLSFAKQFDTCDELDDDECAMLRQLAVMPHAYWVGIEPALTIDVVHLHKIMTDALDKGQVPTIVLYSLPYRSCGGGVPLSKQMTEADYLSWAATIGDIIRYYKERPVNIIIEPGALSHLLTKTDESCYSKTKDALLAERIELLSKTIWEFMSEDGDKNRTNPHVRLFIDAGGPESVPDTRSKLALARALQEIARNAKFDGIAINVGGSASFDENVVWAEDLISLLRGRLRSDLTLAVDISRSGGARGGGCNAPGAALGTELQTLKHDNKRVELVTIIHDPSTSDGDGEGCNGGAPAGEFDMRILREYLHHSSLKHALLAPATRPTPPTTAAQYATTAMNWMKWVKTGFSPVEVGVADIVTKDKYERIFPEHVDFYSYEQFVRGAAATSGFCTTGDTPTRIRECAAFLANAHHETGGGKYVTEIAQNKCPDYCDYKQTGACAPAKDKAYYGRGLLQPSWNYNYCAASKFIFKDDGSTLVQRPEILEQDAAISTQASLWYWMTQASASTMPSHECITKGAGFGCTIRSINGALECNGKKPELVAARVGHYLRILDILGDGKVQPVGRNDC